MERTRVTSVLVALGSVVALGLVAPPAEAAAPANDGPEAPTDVGDVPFVVDQDTTEATADPPGVPACWGQARAHSVWFRVAGSASRAIVVSTKGSDYDTRLSVYTATNAADPPESWKHGGCDDDSGPGTTSIVLVSPRSDVAYYYVMVSTRNNEEAGNLHLTVRRPIKATVTLAKYGRADRIGGTAVVRGTVRCSRKASAWVSVELRQRVEAARVAVGSQARRGIPCGRKETAWTMRITPWTESAFVAGRARVMQTSYGVCEGERWSACLPSRRFARQIVTLR